MTSLFTKAAHLKIALLGGAALIGMGVLSAASAAPIVFTFNPAAAGAPSGTQFTADKLNVLDFARVDLGATSGGQTAFSEHGFLQVNNTSLNNVTPASAPGLNSTYSMYFAFQATGHQTAASFGTSSTGTFDTLTYSLDVAPGVTSFGIDGSNQPFATGAAPTTVATGSLISGATGFSVLSTGVSPSASISTTVSKLIQAFFVSPANVSLELAGAFNNDVNIVNVLNNGTTFTLNGGGGDVTFTAAPVPEPMSLAIIGTGLIGTAFARRRR